MYCRRLRPGEPKGDAGTSRGGWKEPDADQVQELEVVALWDPIQPVEQLIRHPGEGLDQGYARIGNVVISPFRTLLLDQALGIIDQVLEATIVEVRDRKCHAHPPAAWLSIMKSLPESRRTGRPGCADHSSRRSRSGYRCTSCSDRPGQN